MSSLTTQALRYGATGIANTGFGAGVIFALYYLADASVFVANILGYGAGLALSYGLNRAWTFQDRKAARMSSLRFLAVMGVGFLANLSVIEAALGAGLSYPIAQTLGILTYAVIGFFGSRWVVFRAEAVE